MEDSSRIFVKEVDQKLKRMGKTQIELAKDIDFSHTTLNKIMKNKRRLEFNLAVRIATTLDINLDKFKIAKVTNKEVVLKDLVDQMDDLLAKIKELTK